MPANNYLIPLGIDASPLVRGFRDGEAASAAFAQRAGEATATVQRGFQAAVVAQDQFNGKVDVSSKAFAAVKSSADKFIQTLSNVGDFKQADRLKAQLDKITVAFGGNNALKFNVDDSKLAEFQAKLASAGTELKQLGVVVDFAKNQLKQLTPGTAEFVELNSQLQTAEEFMREFATVTGVATEGQKSLKAQLREAKQALADMEIAGQGDTAEFRALSIQAGELEDQIGDVAARVRVLASDTKYLDAGIQAVGALAGGFAAAQGAMALFGDQGEDVQKVIQKVTGAMAILQGIQTIANALNKDSALSVLLFSRAQTTAAVTTAAETEALAANAVVQGEAVVAAEAAVVVEGAEAVATVAATVATEGWTLALLANPIFLIAAVIIGAVVALVAFSGASDDAAEATRKLNEALKNQQDIFDLDMASIKRRTDLRAAEAKTAGKSQAQIGEIEKEGLRQEGQLLVDRINQNQAALDKEFTAEKQNGDNILALNKQLDADRNKLEDINTQGQIKALEQQKEAHDKALDDQKKRVELSKQQQETLNKLTAELSAAETALIVDKYQKQREAADDAYDKAVADAKSQDHLTAAAQKVQTDLLIVLEKDRLAQQRAIDEQELADKKKLQLDADKTLLDLSEDSIKKQLDLIDLETKEKKVAIEQQYKGQADLIAELEAALDASQANKKSTVTVQSTLKINDDAEKTLVNQLELAKLYAGKNKDLVEASEQDILRVKIKYAELNLEALQAAGGAENALAISQAKLLLGQLDKELKDSQKKAGKKTLLDLLGIDPEDQEGFQKVEENATKFLNGFKDLFNGLADLTQQQIDSKQKVVDSYNDQIDDLKDAVDKQTDLQAEGAANDVGLMEQELADKTALRDKEQQQIDELQKKKEAQQKAALVADTIVQTSSLITAAAQIIEGFSSIPIVGVALGIAAVGVMVGAFIAAKIKAFQAVGQGQTASFGGGGLIDGPDHAAGGVKYMAINGTGNIVELEGKEYVINKRSASKHMNITEAINADNFSGLDLNDDSLRQMFNEMGIDMSESSRDIAIQDASDYNAFHFNNTNVVEGNKKELDDIKGHLAILSEDVRNRKDIHETNTHIIITQRGKITRIKKAE